MADDVKKDMSPCPFCLSDVVAYDPSGNCVECVVCHARGPRVYVDIEKAIDAWNKAYERINEE